jgi:O-antigen ligase
MNVSSIKIIKKYPLLGVGTGDYLKMLQEEYKKINFIAGQKNWFNAHNQYLEDFVKNGISGFLVFLLLIVIILKLSWKTKSYMLYCAFAVAFICCFESFLDRHHGTAFLAFFIPFFYKFEQL